MESKLPARSALTSRLPAPTSRLPAPSSRLPAPTSGLRPPTVSSKRSRSPEQAPSAKRQRTYNSGGSGQNKPAPKQKPPPSTTTGRVLKPNITQANVKNLRPTSTAVRKTTVKPSNVKPPAKTGNAPVKAAPAPQTSNKIPPWDLKGRLKDMEDRMKRKDSQMAQWSARIGSLESTNNQLSGTVAQTEEVATSISLEKQRLEQKLAVAESELHEIKMKLQRDTSDFEFTKASLKRQKDALESELNALQTEVAGLKTSIAQLTSAQAGLKSELTATQVSLSNSLNSCQEKDKLITQLQGIIVTNKETIKDFEQKFMEFEKERRVLHNTVQELKGNIRVFCRVRPLLGAELLGNDGEIHHMNFNDDKSIELEKLSDISLSESTINSTRRGTNGRYLFAFDKVFLPESTQTEVFDEISQLVQSALDGYNVCIFAYGQTGSGKTFTMEGPSIEDEETMGMISRATIQIFKSTKGLEDQGWQYEFEASFLEIYNETIRDLLGENGNGVKHEIRLGSGGKDMTVTNLTTLPVTGKEQIVHLLKTASKNRAVGETQCNERSSRSHSVFRLKITGNNEITGEVCAGTLNLIDLAGSERLKESGATGARLKETQNINSSLSNLGKVIMALGNKDPHVPFRNSKLTYLLQNSLGGNSKTLMFANVSPREEHFSETLNSLRFATMVNQCNIGTATKKTKHGK